MKALEKDRTRRYETANGFAADVLRHLSYEPVLAAPPSRAYRLRKFVRKHRGAVIAAESGGPGAPGRHRGNNLGVDPGRGPGLPRPRAEGRRGGKRRGIRESQRVETAEADANDQRTPNSSTDWASAISSWPVAAYDNRDVVLAAERLDKCPEPARLGMALPEAADARRLVHPLWPHGRGVQRGVQPGRHADRHRQ